MLGYPTGGDSLLVTRGIVSRIEATEYAQCPGSNLLAIQIDATINGGNSGGPVVDAKISAMWCQSRSSCTF
jgi:S1-C subfamily serine protease